MTDIFKLTGRFADEVCGLPHPDTPTQLNPERLDWFIGACQEELDELLAADTIEDQVDAILDLIYFAAGRMYEMGVDGGHCFEAIHAANMLKQQGSLAKRPGSLGHDAVKPAGWIAPDLRPLLSRPVRMVGADRGRMQNRKNTAQLKLLVLGYGRHGKDTVSEMLRDLYGLRFTSSSAFCAERVMMPHFDKIEDGPVYLSPKDCFDDRHHHRQAWYEAIRDFNRPDPTALARAILENNDVYCGMRSKAELHACRNAGVFDHIIWVDASDRGVPPESHTSCTVEPWMADFVVDNGGTVEDLLFNVSQLMKRLLP